MVLSIISSSLKHHKFLWETALRTQDNGYAPQPYPPALPHTGVAKQYFHDTMYQGDGRG